MRLVSKDAEEGMTPDYRDMDQPAYIRNKRAAAGGGDGGGDLDYLDIPAFLRRQAD
jgi:cell division protein FtsZ